MAMGDGGTTEVAAVPPAQPNISPPSVAKMKRAAGVPVVGSLKLVVLLNTIPVGPPGTLTSRLFPARAPAPV
jgi:hypothetical protein